MKSPDSAQQRCKKLMELLRKGDRFSKGMYSCSWSSLQFCNFCLSFTTSEGFLATHIHGRQWNVELSARPQQWISWEWCVITIRPGDRWRPWTPWTVLAFELVQWYYLHTTSTVRLPKGWKISTDADDSAEFYYATIADAITITTSCVSEAFHRPLTSAYLLTAARHF